jgi:hypothetical protein
MGITRGGRIAVLTNFAERPGANKKATTANVGEEGGCEPPPPPPPSRGELPVGFLKVRREGKGRQETNDVALVGNCPDPTTHC